jgi:Fe2+ transport system protein FeoA
MILNNVSSPPHPAINAMDQVAAPSTPPTTQPRRLTTLAPRDIARVTRLDGEHEGVVRLKALGVCVGRRLELVKAGDPLIVRVLGARVGLSALLASVVYVESI